MTTLTSEQESVTELLRRAEITSKARYHAAKRMAAHGWYSQWTLAMLAVGQIVISLIDALKLKTNFSPSYVDFGAIFFGVLVLAYSLLLGMANYSARSVKLHECGLELGALARRLFLLAKDAKVSSSIYDNAAKDYYSILDKYENHSRADYLVAHFEYYAARHAKVKTVDLSTILEHARLWKVKGTIYVLHIMQFSHYFLSMLLLAAWVYFMVAPH